MRARDVMTEGVVTVEAGSSAEEAWQLMRAEGIHHLLVGSTTHPQGVLSAYDLGGRAGTAMRRTASVSDLMAIDVPVVSEDETVRRIANRMRGRPLGCVVVSNGRRATGIITVSDLLELLGRGAERPSPRGERSDLHHRVPHRKSHRQSGVW
jgi:CBS domain-containing protein